MKFYQESVDVFYRDAEDILQAYWDEADERRASSNMSIDIDSYKKMEEVGILRIYTLRNQGELVGFIIFVLADCVHANETKAITEISYLKPEYRGQSLMPDMYSMVEQDLKEQGVKWVFWTLKTEFPHNNLMDKLGLKHVENVYMKEIV